MQIFERVISHVMSSNRLSAGAARAVHLTLPRVQLGRPATSGYTKVSGRLRSLEAARAFLISDF